MRISINGEERELDSPCTVGQLLDELGLAGGACAVEVNATLVPRSEHASRTLAAGDTVELVTLVGGG